MIIERPFAVFWGIVLLVICLTVSFVRKRPLGRKLLLIFSILYITAVVAVTVFPVIIDPEIMVMTDKTFNLIPFSTISDLLFRNSDLKTVFLQIVGNVLMCIPFGVALPLIRKPKKRLYYILYAFAFPVTIELTQLMISVINNSFYRTIDIDDVILNFAGVLIGYAIYKILPSSVKKFFG